MPSLKDLRNRINSVKSTQKITAAMKMVAAAKLRRAQEQAMSARPYAERMERMLGSLAEAMGGQAGAPPLLAGTGKPDVHLVVVMSSDRGLCGSFNSSIVREARKLSIPVVGIVDTNCDPDEVDYVIPGNDDALRAIRLFASKISESVIEGRALASEHEFAAEKIITEEPEEGAQELLSMADVPFAETAERESEAGAETAGWQRKAPGSEAAAEAEESPAPAVNAAE